ncbi:MAG TPA: IS5 family transposase [Terriglobales bacterium]|nr:IS5 family transposase [Terriglobales bacterium]
MRGNDDQLQSGMFSYVSLEERIPATHPLRGVRKLADAVLVEMSKDFDGLYAQVGRPSIPPERLFRALLLQIFYSVRSERLLMEQLDYNLLFRWFVGLEIDEPVWNHAVFSKNRDRLLNQEVAQQFFARVKAKAQGLMSDEHFTVDGTLIEAWASHKSFQRKEGEGKPGPGAGSNFHGEKRSNETHESKTDPEARLYKKSAGQEAKLSYLGHVLVENRHGLIAAAMTTQADGTAERDAALLLVDDLRQGRSGRITVGADKGYDSRDFVSTIRELGATPHISQNTRNRRSAIDGRTTRHSGYAISLSKRWLVEKPFGWLKQVGPLKKVKLRGLAKVDWLFVFSCAAFNLLRIPKLREQCE